MTYGAVVPDFGEKMLKRKIEKDLLNWITSGEKALLIYGVRQAGKTYIIRAILEQSGCDYVEFNLIRQAEIVDILREASSIDDLILKLSLYSSKKIIPGKTIIFLMKFSDTKKLLQR